MTALAKGPKLIVTRMHRDQASVSEQRGEDDGGVAGAGCLVRGGYGKLCQAAATSNEAEEDEDKEKLQGIAGRDTRP